MACLPADLPACCPSALLPPRLPACPPARLPVQLTEEAWQHSLDEALASGAPHISTYDLQVEEHTPFAGRYSPGEAPLPSDDAAADMYCRASEVLRGAGGWVGWGRERRGRHVLPGQRGAARRRWVGWVGAGATRALWVGMGWRLRGDGHSLHFDSLAFAGGVICAACRVHSCASTCLLTSPCKPGPTAPQVLSTTR